MQCESGQLRGGPNFTRGHCLKVPEMNPALEGLVRGPAFQPTDTALLSSILQDASSEHHLTITYYQKTQVASQLQDNPLDHSLRRYEWYEKKRLLEHCSEYYPVQLRVGQISNLSPHNLARLLCVPIERVTAMHSSDTIAVEVHGRRGLPFATSHWSTR